MVETKFSHLMDKIVSEDKFQQGQAKASMTRTNRAGHLTDIIPRDTIVKDLDLS